jgi:hypothetical protein
MSYGAGPQRLHRVTEADPGASHSRSGFPLRSARVLQLHPPTVAYYMAGCRRFPLYNSQPPDLQRQLTYFGVQRAAASIRLVRGLSEIAWDQRDPHPAWVLLLRYISCLG